MKDKKLKVECWYYGFLSAPNGVAKFLKSLDRKFEADKDIEFILKTADSNNNAVRIDKGGSLEAIDEVKVLIKKTVLKFAKISSVIALFYVYYSSIRRIKKLIASYGRSSDDSVLFFNDIISCALYYQSFNNIKNNTILVLHSNGDPCSMILETFPSFKGSFLFRYYENLINVALHNANDIVVLGNKNSSIFKAKYPIYKGKVNVINNGISDLLLNHVDIDEKIKDVMKTKKIRFVSVGTVCKRKGFDLLIESFLKLDNEFNNRYTVEILGDGDLLEGLKEQIPIEKRENFIFRGSVDDVSSFLVKNDVFILTSRDEGLPISGIEALRVNLPLIVTDVGAMGELVSNKNGILCKVEIDSITEAIKKILNNLDTYNEMALNSRKLFLHSFSIDLMISRYKDLFLK